MFDLQCLRLLGTDRRSVILLCASTKARVLTSDRPLSAHDLATAGRASAHRVHAALIRALATIKHE